MRVGVRRRDLREVMSTISQNGYELVQQWLRVRRQAVSCQIPFTYCIYGNGRSDNRFRRFIHLGHNILFLPPAEVKVGVSHSANREGVFRPSKSFP